MNQTFTAASTVAGAVKDLPSDHSWGSRITGIPRMIRAVFSGEWKEGSKIGVSASLAGLLYVLSPIDFIPEGLLAIFGLGDDLIVGTLSAVYLMKSTDRYLTSSVESPSGDIIQGTVLHSSTVSVQTGDTGTEPGN